MAMTLRKGLILNHKTGTLPHTNLRAYIRREIIKRYKKIKGCSKCGYNKTGAALHFDHRDISSKLFNVSGSDTKPFTLRGKTWKHNPIRNKGIDAWTLVKEEIYKCDIFCANCHAEKTEAENDAGTKSHTHKRETIEKLLISFEDFYRKD